MLHATVKGARRAPAALLLAVLFALLAASAAPAAPVLPIPDTLWKPAPGSVPQTGNYVYLVSDQNEYVGAGKTYLYTQTDAVIKVTAVGSHLSVRIQGYEDWWGDFVTASGSDPLAQGYYPAAGGYPFAAPPSLSWSGEGRGPSSPVGWITVDAVEYTSGTLTAVDLRFEQSAGTGLPALHGAIHWRADDPTTPPGPVLPVPDTLWKPAAGSVPATGNYVYFKSDPGDWVGGGGTYLYTPANAVITVSADAGHLNVQIEGDSWWRGDIKTMTGVTSLQAGYYAGVTRYPFNNPAKGGMDWSGGGAGSNTLTGWFAIDSVTFSNGTLTAIDLRFEQHSEGNTPALRGALHWRADDTTQPPGPVLPVPDTLWRPAPGSTPASGDFVYLKSDPGDWVGAGRTYLYTPADAVLSVSANDGHLSVNVNGDTWWYGNFQTMNSLTRLQPGYYPGLSRYPFHNPVKGGLDWSGDGRGSNTLTGWFAVDAVTYTDGVLTAIDLRFEQHSEGGTPALHGAIHWRSDDTSGPAGPVLPIPDSLWKPPAGIAPDADSFVYLDSDAGDYIGQGGEYLYTEPEDGITVSEYSGRLRVEVQGEEHWYGDFKPMAGVTSLQQGYYPGVSRYPFQNPTKGGMDWYGEGRGSNTLTGWFAVDDVTHVDGELTGVDLRFELHSEGGAPALHGAIHWRKFAPASVSGTVTAPDHSVLGGVDVSAYRRDAWGDWQYVDDTSTDPAGSYVLGGLHGGTYRLEFDDYSGDYLTQWFNGATTMATATDIPVERGTSTTGLNAQMRRAGHIAGTVKDARGVGLEDVEVVAWRADGSGGWRPVTGTSTTAGGAYDLGGLDTGAYRLEFSDWTGRYIGEWYDDQTGVAAAKDLAVTAGATTGGVDAVLGDASHIKGVVKDPLGKGLEGIDVTAYQRDGSGGWEYVNDVQTEEDGTYDLGGLHAATYRVEFDDWSETFATQCWDGKPDLAGATDIPVGPAATVGGINATLSAPGHIKGKVGRADQSGLEDIAVVAYRQDDRGAWKYAKTAWTAWDGTYDLTASRSGSYKLQFVDYSGAYGVQWYAGAATLGAGTAIWVTPGLTTTGINATLTPAGHISGVVRAPGRTGLPEVDVTAYQPDGLGGWVYVNDVLTEQDGSYDLGGLASGPYRLEFDDFSGHGYASQFYDNQPSLEACDDVLVTAGATVPNVNAVLGIHGTDATAPTTTVSGAGASWYKTGVVTLTATDAVGGSGVERTEYRVHGSKTWNLYVSPLLITAEGSTTYDYRSVDVAQNAEAIKSFTVNVDSVAPTASATGAAEGAWLSSPATVVLTGADAAPSSGVASVTYQLDGATQTVQGLTASVPLPGSPSGTHTLRYFATDQAGNSGAEQLLTVHIDTLGPVTAAKAAAGRVRKSVTLRCRVADNLSPQATGISVVVKNKRHKVVKTITVGAKATGTWFSVKWRPAAKGTYSYAVYAKDLAGNRQTKAGSAGIIVR